MSHTMLYTAAILMTFTLAWVQPLCLDFRSPFRPEDKLAFCSEYSELGCCTPSDDQDISREFEEIQEQATSKDLDWSSCHGYVKQILCQTCSPHAAHIYSANDTSPRSFPGLCTDYCHDYYDKCRAMTQFIDPSLSKTRSRDRFCRSVAAKNPTYCYPDVLRKPTIQQNLRQPGLQGASPPCLCLEKIVDDVANPIWAGHANDGTGRLFIALQNGRVYAYDTQTGRLASSPFLDKSDDLKAAAFPADERGFLGMAFHPDYANNGRFFVFYSTPRSDDDVPPPGKPGLYNFKTRISEMRVNPLNADRADQNYEKVVIELLQPYFNHNGGQLHFGTDGYLYIFTGDGGAAGDPLKNSQDKSVLFGKALRLDVDTDTNLPYSIPPDNPFVGSTARPEIYAFGFRNPWRCGLDRGDRDTEEGKGRVLCGDVGQNDYEEVDLLEKGGNYGWSTREGFECYDNDLCGNIGTEKLPVAAYDHDVGKSVIGGVFYRGCENLALNGLYIYGDTNSRRLWSLHQEDDDTWTNQDVSLCGDGCGGDLVGTLTDSILSFGEDEDGEIYMLVSDSTRSTSCDATVYKIVDPTGRQVPSACVTDQTRLKRVRLPSRTKQTSRYSWASNAYRNLQSLIQKGPLRLLRKPLRMPWS